MTGKFYIETTFLDERTDKFLIYELSATTNISISVPSTLTTYTLESGADVADNIVVKNEKISLQGIVTDVSQADSSFTGTLLGLLSPEQNKENDVEYVEDYIISLKGKIKNKETFSVYFSDNMAALRDCVITNFTYNKTNQYGGEAWLVKLTLQQARFANRARFVAEPAAEWKDLLEAKKQSAANKKDVTKAQEEAAQTNKTLVENQGATEGVI